MSNIINNVGRKIPIRQVNRSLEPNCLKQFELDIARKRSRSVSSISSKQQSFDRTLQKRFNYRLSREHITLLIQQQRVKQEQIISKNESLNQYYTSFINLFQIIYLTSSSVIKHTFYNRERDIILEKLQIIGSLIGDFQQQWTLSKTSKLIILSENIYQLSKSITDFLKRIQFVARKICINKVKKNNILKAFLNQPVKIFWKTMQQKKLYYDKNQFLFEMYLTDVERLCYYDVYKFINKFLCKAEFKEIITRWCKKQQIDQQTKIDFTFQFMFVEEFCLADDCQIIEPKPKSQKQIKCFIM